MKKHKTNSAPQPQKRLSIIRLLLVIIFLVGTAYSSIFGWNNWQAAQTVASINPWFAPYVDVTSTPFYPFEQTISNSTSNMVLSFIVSSHQDPCIPSWGGYYTLDEAAAGLDLDRRIARLNQQDGKVAISFGGANNHELSLNCLDSEKLLAAYQSVINRYQIDTLDLDLENESLNNKDASLRRAQVISKLQTNYRQNGKNLAVWLTLPATPAGLSLPGTDAVTQMLSQGVDLAGVNVMTMNYGQSRDSSHSMFEASKDALTQTHRQLGILYEDAGISLQSKTLWRKIGATPMIGQNDIASEVFTLEDAKLLNLFAYESGLGRMSLWSANRDVRCGGNYVNLQIVSDSCSGVDQDPQSFTFLLNQNFDGDLSQNATIVTIQDKESEEVIIDDPQNSPYQIWSETGAYIKGTKVVWRGNVYEAKWWSKADIPDNPVLQSWETPWQLIGPVLPGETPIPQPTLPPNTYPQWSGTKVYEAGERILFEGIPFQAKWWNQGDSPAASVSNADSSPWLPLEIHEILSLLESNQDS